MISLEGQKRMGTATIKIDQMNQVGIVTLPARSKVYQREEPANIPSRDILVQENRSRSKEIKYTCKEMVEVYPVLHDINVSKQIHLKHYANLCRDKDSRRGPSDRRTVDMHPLARNATPDGTITMIFEAGEWGYNYPINVVGSSFRSLWCHKA